MKNLKLILALTLILLPSKLFAADITIEMLNRLDNESMVFSQKIVNTKAFPFGGLQTYVIKIIL